MTSAHRAAISIGSLLCIRALGTRLARRSPWLSRVIEGVTSCRSYITMLPGSMSERVSCSSQWAPIVIRSPYVAFPRLPVIFTHWPIGAVRSPFRRDGVNQCLLDSDLSDSGGSWPRGLPGQRTAREERARSQNGRLRLPVASVPAIHKSMAVPNLNSAGMDRSRRPDTPTEYAAAFQPETYLSLRANASSRDNAGRFRAAAVATPGM